MYSDNLCMCLHTQERLDANVKKKILNNAGVALGKSGLTIFKCLGTLCLISGTTTMDKILKTPK